MTDDHSEHLKAHMEGRYGRPSPEEKPLHVRVAEALPHGRIWRAEHPTEMALDDAAGTFILAAVGEWLEEVGTHRPYWRRVRRYDTDWSATGPLIDRFGLVVYGTDRPWVDAPSHKHISRDGETVLVAICNLVIALKEAGKLVPGSVGHEMPKEGPYLLPSTEMKPWERMP